MKPQQHISDQSSYTGSELSIIETIKQHVGISKYPIKYLACMLICIVREFLLHIKNSSLDHFFIFCKKKEKQHLTNAVINGGKNIIF